MRASRTYEIIRFAQHGLDIKDMSKPMNDEEKKFYESILEDLKKWRAKGIEPMYELPFDYDEDNQDIYPDDFDDEFVKKYK